MNKPYSSAKLSEHHLRIGILSAFIDEVNRGLKHRSRNPMGRIYVFDDKTEIFTPAKPPENWPIGLIRIYSDVRRGHLLPEYGLRHFEPAVNCSAIDVGAHATAGTLDHQGLRFLASTSYCGLSAHYLVFGEYDQLSFVPLLGHHKDSVDDVIALAGKLTSYDKRLIIELYESASIKQPYDEETLMGTNNIPHTYHNWLLLNACIMSRVVTLRQVALAELADAVQDRASGMISSALQAPIDVSEEKVD